MEYKVETKHDKWLVTLESGCYSDYSMSVIIVSANNQDEVWHFLKYLYDNKKLPEIYWVENIENKEYMVSEEYGKYPSDKEEDNWREVTVKIEPLPVHYFKV